MSIDNKLDHYFQCGLNCLLRGEHGVGKTTLISECFERNGLVVGESALIFSAATIDPWVDFIGVPKEVTKDGKTYLDFILPKHFAEDNVQAIFFDEFNRSHKKIRNAVLELIQFKSINGRKFNNLKVVWAAINPEDSEDYEYDVEVLDPAQKDRFQIIIDVPYKPDYAYFENKYGADWASAAIDWWKELPKKLQKQVSPRRLDYALEVSKVNGDLADVLPHETAPRRLSRTLRDGSPKQILSNLLNANKNDELKDFLSDTNNVESCMSDIIKYKKHMKRCLPSIREENLSTAIFKHVEVKNHIEEELSKISTIDDPSRYPDKEEASKYVNVLGSICKSNSDKAMSSWASYTLSSCIPGFMLIGGPKLTLSQLADNITERYEINPSPLTSLESSESDDNSYDVETELNVLRKSLRNSKQTSEKQKILDKAYSIVLNNQSMIDKNIVVLDILNIFCERSQKKTICGSDTINTVLGLSEWGINAYAAEKEMNEKNIKILIKNIPHLFTKCLIGEIEENGEFSIFSLTHKAKVFKELMR
ncbi:hypothetical protein CMI47_08595 [Candidatus Pacearchaeota archaeon]|jgi:hypothetical protein|nr:hypothetical protein [Candidatus Pacearchaeota archaeon]|tara:strand:+ start:4159 stop:5763 length:1605 start_codon:yes stop_codon:yes gene_type:complete